MTVLSALDLHKAFGATPLLDGVCLTLDEGEKVGLVGRNGCGKSTLARIMSGAEPADGGTIAPRRGASIAYLHQSPVFDAGQTAHQVVAAGLHSWALAKAQHDEATQMLNESSDERWLAQQEAAASAIERLGGWDQLHQVDIMLQHLGVLRPESLIETMSGGERRRVALARLLVSHPDVAILDEPTNHLDVQTVDWLETHLRDEFPGAVLLITHDRYLLDRVATRTVELDGGKIYSYEGGYEEYLERKAERMAHAERTEQNRQNFLRRELEWLRRQPKARTGKQKARIDRAEAARDAPKLKLPSQAQLLAQEVRSGKTILEFHDMTLTMGPRTLISGLEWILTQGERVGIIGPNGTGKTSLLKSILGELQPTSGQVVVGQNTQIAYFDQERAELDDDQSIFDNIVKYSPRIEINGEPVEPRSYLERFLFDPHKQRQPVGSLSGGERARVALAKLLSRGANLILLDEPTNDLDLATLGSLEQMLVDFGGAALVVTHDRWFLDRVATSILAFEGDGKVVRYPGNYTTYRRLLKEEKERKGAAASRDPSASSASKSSRPPGSKSANTPEVGAVRSAAATTKGPQLQKKGLTFGEKIELEGIMAKIEAADARVSLLEKELADPNLYVTRGDDARKLTLQLEEARRGAHTLMARWEALEAKKG